MDLPAKMKKGFSYDEALFLSNCCKLAYEIFQHDDGTIDDTELKEIYKALHRNQEWEIVHSIRNDHTNVRALILKRANFHQYVLAFRGTIVTDRKSLELTDWFADLDWQSVAYAYVTNQRIKVAQGFNVAFESVADEIKIFFQTLFGTLKPKDLAQVQQLRLFRKFACISAMVDAASLRMQDDFEPKARKIISQILADGEIDNQEELDKVFDFVKDPVLQIEPLTDRVELYVTGHSLGGALCQLGTLALRRWFDTSDYPNVFIKTYAVASPKVGNPDFAKYYNQLMGVGMSFRIENVLDSTPTVPFDPPFPISALAPGGVRLGSYYLGSYANGGEVHNVMGLGSQSGSLSFGGILELPVSVPFPHSIETYIALLTEQQKSWHQILTPIQTVLRPFLKDIITEELDEILISVKSIESSLEEHFSENGGNGDATA
ncbi:MAG TPA: hypothetical protein DDZ80_11380 [Cyanobacteria bacterium UBA8803]|nr:hypothetical protein [Cyanobacteria bacterium UBA9273]HBL59092.1 hypothetical protein [Cyanobacteria bacterium UBA8803]